MHILVNDKIEIKYHKICLDTIDKAYPGSKSLISDRNVIIDICDRCITALVQEFKKEVHKYVNYNDLLLFLWIYSKNELEGEDRHITLQMCRNIFSVIPTMQLDSLSKPHFSSDAPIDFSNLYFITKHINTLSQQLSIVYILPENTLQLEIGKCSFAITYKNSTYAETHMRLKQALRDNPIKKQCTTLKRISDFSDILSIAFGCVADDFISLVCTPRSLYLDLDNIEFSDFVGILDSTIQDKEHRTNPMFFTNLYNKYSQPSFLKGLILTGDDTNLETAIRKPYNPNCRTRFRPIIRFNIDGRYHYISTPQLCQEAIEELVFNMLPFNELPNEWKNNSNMKQYAKFLFDEHDKWLEDPIENLFIRKGMHYFRNIKAINNISLEKAKAYIGNVEYSNKKVGEIDFITIDESKRTIYVIDAKLMKTRYHFQSFTLDKNHFIGDTGYEKKLLFKIDWVSKHLSDVSKAAKIDCSGYQICGFFVTETFIYHSLHSQLPIIPISDLETYLTTKDKLWYIHK